MTIPANQNGNRNQTPPDLEDVLAQLEELGDEGQPVEGQENDIQFSDTDEGKKQAHAFAKQSRLLRQAKSVIKSFKDAPREPQAPAQPPPQMSGQNHAAQASAIMYQLQLEAIQNTGIADPAHPMVVLEMNRLYAEKVQNLRNRSEAGTKAPAVLEAVIAMPQFKRLTPEDLQEIKARVSQLAPEAQADERTVKTVFNLFVGENIERFTAPPSGGQRATDQGAGAGAAASSDARSRGRGVPPGAPNGGSSAPDQKPPNEQESKEMRSIGLDPFVAADIARYRSASKRRGQFGGG